MALNKYLRQVRKAGARLISCSRKQGLAQDAVPLLICAHPFLLKPVKQREDISTSDMHGAQESMLLNEILNTSHVGVELLTNDKDMKEGMAGQGSYLLIRSCTA